MDFHTELRKMLLPNMKRLLFYYAAYPFLVIRILDFQCVCVRQTITINSLKNFYSHSNMKVWNWIRKTYEFVATLQSGQCYTYGIQSVACGHQHQNNIWTKRLIKDAGEMESNGQFRISTVDATQKVRKNRMINEFFDEISLRNFVQPAE